MPYKPTTNLKLYYSITELAEELGVLTSELRYYEAEGVIPPADVSGRKNNYVGRKWTSKHADEIREVFEAAKTEYYTLHGLRNRVYKSIPDEVVRFEKRPKKNITK